VTADGAVMDTVARGRTAIGSIFVIPDDREDFQG
jgi:hypothetical protein